MINKLPNDPRIFYSPSFTEFTEVFKQAVSAHRLSTRRWCETQLDKAAAGRRVKQFHYIPHPVAVRPILSVQASDCSSLSFRSACTAHDDVQSS
jgi:hypothetical protein